MRAKSFMYVCIGLLALAGAYQLGVQRVEAQLGEEFTGIAMWGTGTAAITSTGDVYARSGAASCGQTGMFWDGSAACEGWTFMGNVLGGAVNVEPATASDLKTKYREED